MSMENTLGDPTPLVMERLEPGDGKEPCPECGGMYKPGPGMGVHRHSAHGTGKRSDKRKECSECGKMFPSKDLARHRRSIHGIGPGRPPGFSPAKVKASDLTAEQITRTTAAMLWPDGVPHDKLEILMRWNTQTTLFLDQAQG